MGQYLLTSNFLKTGLRPTELTGMMQKNRGDYLWLRARTQSPGKSYSSVLSC